MRSEIRSGGHAFQFMRTPDDQVAALRMMGRHLEPGGRVVLHLDVAEQEWLNGLPGVDGPLEPGRVLTHPDTGERWRPANAWTYEPAGRTATVVVTWDRLDADDRVVETLQEPPRRLNNPRPESVREAVASAGLATELVLGDFGGSRFGERSDQMIWIAQSPAILAG